MVDIRDLIEQFESGASGEIVKTQTTYLDVVCSFRAEPALPRQYRIHYRGKREFSIEKAQFTSLRLFDSHPLLLQYTEPIVAVQLASAVRDQQLFRDDINAASREVFGTWRSAEDYNFIPLNEFLAKSYGILMEAPISFAEAVIQAGGKSGVKLTMLERYEPKGIAPRALLFDEWYVIADDFRVEALL